MDRPICHEFAEPLDGYPELASEALARECERFDRNAELRRSFGHGVGRVAQFVFITLISFAVIFGAGVWGLSRTERAYQEASRV